MKIYNKMCKEIWENGGILKDDRGACYYKPYYVLHREDGPAWEWDDNKAWWYNGKLIMDTNGDVTPDQLLDFKLRLI